MSNSTIWLVIFLEIVMWLLLCWGIYNIYFRKTSEVKKMKKFEPGVAVMTEGIKERYFSDPRFRLFVNVSVGKHLAGDWGDLSEEDKKRNDDAVTNGGRIFSSYIRVVQNREEEINVITEADRSMTTVMFPEEY